MNGNDRSIAGFTMLAHGTFHTYELSIPLFIVIWLDVFDVSAFVLGVVVSVGYGLIGVGALPSGVLADQYGSRRLIVAAVVGMGGGFFLLALAPNVYTLCGAIVVWGAAASIYHPAGLSLISRGAEERGTVFAYHGVGGNVGTAFGPLLAALLLVFFDWRIVIVALAIPAVVVVAVGSAIEFDETAATAADGGERPDTHDSDDGFDLGGIVADSRLLFTTGFALAFVIVMLYGTYYRGLLTFMPDMIANLPQFSTYTVMGQAAEPAQYIYTGLLMVGILGQYAGGRITDHIRTEYALLATLTSLAVLAVVFLPAAGWGVVPFLTVCAILGFCLYATAPIYQVVIAEYAAEDVHGLSYGFTYLGMFGVGAGGAALAGALLTYFSAAVLLGTLGAIALLAAGLVVVVLEFV
ncbi:MFS transporter [Halalkalicoccus jeotgali]|uniref:Major facilitator superfamily MFS_1 n=1 Tax=Halalkalicoccus jeotgali (strain DSM 18796 / CECT 7217 / JCM 14584 / KCTC 4019 / B3) TaxID=795797 RepID=D8J3M5_HALJB|nr:MFS transporter [Halalkalicoccus jeotgali]ADJ15332.1 major facilitator superfamily MFS_1 [Halalkalicoccus jeotgali B3]ELY35455.1 major facilitator superfamily protein [Halalkalicoccus jeotgali B3]